MRHLERLAGLTLCALLGAPGGRALALDWSNAWSTPEQRAQRLLDAGHPLEAARLFTDPRRRAYAESRAGRYEEAAKQLAPFHDVDSEYNRGNALARTGDLRAALASYDAALEQMPDDREVRHNRDLVARALEQRSAQQSGASGTPQQGGAGKQQGTQRSQAAGSQSAGGSSQAGARAGSPMGQPSDGSSRGGGAGEENGEQAKRDAQLAAEMKRRAAQLRQGRAGNSGPSGPSGPTGSARTGQPGTRDSAQGEAIDGQWPPAKSEQTLALEQWLRRIPEDPGGLLRRKFLIEHIERHQGTEQ